MSTIGQIVQFVSGQLLDQEPGNTYVRWSIADLVEYLNDGLRQIAMRRPDQMITDATLPLFPGSRQGLPAQYLYLFEISSCLDPDTAETVATMSRMEWDAFAASNLPAPSAAAAGTCGGPRDYAYNPNKPREFWVWPPIPAGGSGVVNASVRVAPLSFTTADLATTLTGPGATHQSALYAWMRHLAYQKDQESLTDFASSQAAKNEFMEALGLSQQSDSRHLSGWNMGQRGDGDPMAARR